MQERVKWQNETLRSSRNLRGTRIHGSMPLQEKLECGPPAREITFETLSSDSLSLTC